MFRSKRNADYSNYVDRVGVKWLIIPTLDGYVFKLAYIFNVITFYNYVSFAYENIKIVTLLCNE